MNSGAEAGICQVTIHHSLFTIHKSPFTEYHLSVHCSPITGHRLLSDLEVDTYFCHRFCSGLLGAVGRTASDAHAKPPYVRHLYRPPFVQRLAQQLAHHRQHPFHLPRRHIQLATGMPQQRIALHPRTSHHLRHIPQPFVPSVVVHQPFFHFVFYLRHKHYTLTL